MSNAIEIKNLSKKFKDFSLENVNITLPRGYIMGFIGPNGAGKSTTISLMLNVMKSDGGQVFLNGVESSA
ncbi:MAG: ATP-binding cassette domain-containing protein, partial [Oscillospiraceae bacterium]